MELYYRAALITLISITVLGLIAIPFGNPKFIDRAIILEISFATLSVLVGKGYSNALYACIPLALLVIIGNTLAPPHVKLMMTFSKPLNAIILIVGGYVLQFALIYTSLKSILYKRLNKLRASTKTS